MSKSQKLGFNSKLIHAGGFEDCYGSATVPYLENGDHMISHDSLYGSSRVIMETMQMWWRV